MKKVLVVLGALALLVAGLLLAGFVWYELVGAAFGVVHPGTGLGIAAILALLGIGVGTAKS